MYYNIYIYTYVCQILVLSPTFLLVPVLFGKTASSTQTLEARPDTSVEVAAHNSNTWNMKHWQYLFREYVPRGVCTASTLSISMFSFYFTLMSAKKKIICGKVFCVVLCWILLSRSQSIMSQPRPGATFFTFTFKPHWSPPVTCSGSTSTFYHPYTLYISLLGVVMVPHYFHRNSGT